MRTFVCLLCVSIGSLYSLREVSAQDASDAAPIPAAARAANGPFAGVWKLVGEEARDANGQAVPAGPSAASGGRIGYITYDTAGYMGVVLAWVDQPPHPGPQPTAQQAAAALARYNSYWGSFAVNEAAGVVTHQTFGAVIPSFAGTNQEREFKITGNRLTLRPPAAANGDLRTLTWERVPDLPDLTPTHRKLIGFWKLVSFDRRDAKGDPLVSNPGQTGFIVYTASGEVMVHLMQPYRRRNVGQAPTPEETLATYRSYASYFGPYTVDESTQSIVHRVVASFNSAAVGAEYQWSVELSGKRLTLAAPVTKDGNGDEVHSTMVWERLSD